MTAAPTPSAPSTGYGPGRIVLECGAESHPTAGIALCQWDADSGAWQLSPAGRDGACALSRRGDRARARAAAAGDLWAPFREDGDKITLRCLTCGDHLQVGQGRRSVLWSALDALDGSPAVKRGTVTLSELRAVYEFKARTA